jgi:(aminoalkyl)phosphonate N-acetyltransferase
MARKQYRTPLMASIHETAKGLHAAGVMDKRTMSEFDDLTLNAAKSTMPAMTGIDKERPFSIRPIAAADAAAAAFLCGELGYPVSASVLEQRIRTIAVLPGHAVLVACLEDGRVAGWIDVSITHHLPAEPYGEIGGLVVSEDVRGQGIGRELLAAAERWISERGIGQALVRSRVVRERAHRFYLREGYSHTKTTAVFVKPLAPGVY